MNITVFIENVPDGYFAETWREQMLYLQLNRKLYGISDEQLKALEVTDDFHINFSKAIAADAQTTYHFIGAIFAFHCQQIVRQNGKQEEKPNS